MKYFRLLGVTVAGGHPNYKEIAALLKMRQDPQHARDEVRLLTGSKLDEIEERLADLQILRNELRLLLNLCSASKDGCPIIESIDNRER